MNMYFNNVTNYLSFSNEQRIIYSKDMEFDSEECRNTRLF